MNWNHKDGPFGVFENQMGAGLAYPSISLLFKESKKFGGFRHLINS